MTTEGTVRERIVSAASRLLADGGTDAASMRAISAAAGVQAPAIYRLFGDKEGLLDEVAVATFEAYLAEKTATTPGSDPVEDLRAGWDRHLAFGLAHPEVYALVYRPHRSGPDPPAVRAAAQVLADHIRRIAEAGRLRVPERRAVQLVHAAGTGVALTLIATPERERDPVLADLVREAAIAAITVAPPAAVDPGPVAAAVTLRATLDEATELTVGERALLGEWLDRIADG